MLGWGPEPVPSRMAVLLQKDMLLPELLGLCPCSCCALTG